MKFRSGKYDIASLGEVMMRFDSVDVPTAKATSFRIWHGGGETNVAEGASACFGLRTAIITALIDDSVGRNIESQSEQTASIPVTSFGLGKTWIQTAREHFIMASTSRGGEMV